MTASSGQRPSDSDKPTPDAEAAAPDEPVEPQPPEHDTRIGLDRILPELLRKGFEAGRVPLEKVSESIFPRDIGSNVLSQLGDLRSGVVKAVAQEVGRFLREADIASEVRKVLTGMDIEASVKLRFKAREDGTLKPELKVDLEQEQDEKSRPNSDRRKR